MTSKQLLIEQFSAGYNQTNWFVSLKAALDGLTAKQASLQDGSSNNSIWQIVNHLIYWNGRYLNRFKEIQNPEAKSNNDATFAGDRTSGTEKEWKETLEQINNIFSEWEKSIQKADDGKLETKPIKDSEGTWYSYIGTINMHNAYHIGQIVTIRKHQGSWDPIKGVS